MRIGMQLDHRGGFLEAAAELRDLERAGLACVLVSELYSFDAVSQLGYLAAVTDRLEICSGILQIYSRTPTLTAMTAAGLDHVSGGRFTLGIGASGPQVVEGFHGVPYDAPLGRTREVVEICRKVWRRETLVHEGRHYHVPLGPGEGTGLGKPLKLLNRPVRERIPVVIAAMGPKNVALAAEVAEAWQPIFFLPERAADVFGPALEKGLAERDPACGDLRVQVDVPACIGADVADALDAARLRLAHYVGGMGARGHNFYFDLACRYGYAAEAARIQDLYLDGRRRDAAAAVPEELVRGVSLIGSPAECAERVAAFAATGVTTLSLSPVGRAATSREERLRLVEQAVALTG
ncbi:LLM class F420-dependent oxidoreductase [Streptomyces rubrogriseus]|uniref:LLM class F420-dependent oxidoreductase n=1 Tax=Streptomyces rubrogriseus TaxID=194673 RepID=UPI0036F98D7E